MHSTWQQFLARSWPVAVLLVAMASIQSGAAVAKTLFPLIGPAATTSMRLAFGAALLLVVLRPWRRSLAPGAWKIIVAYGSALGTMNFLFYQALQSVPLGIVVALEFTGPLTVALLFSKRRLDLLWVALAVAGLIVLLWPGSGLTGPIDPYGAACALGAGVCWALYILFGQKAGSLQGTQSAALGITVAAVVIAPAGLFELSAAMFTPVALGLALVVAILSTALPYTLEMIALPRLPTQTFGTLMSLEPAVGALSGLLFLGEDLGLTQWLAIAAIIAASMGTTLGMRRSEAPARRKPRTMPAGEQVGYSNAG